MPSVSPSVCAISAGSASWQFAATPSIPQPINRLGQMFTAQYKNLYLALDPTTSKSLIMQSQPYLWSLESTSMTSSSLWAIFAAAPLDYMTGPTFVSYIAAPSSPTAALTVTTTDPGSDTPFILNANGVWFAVDVNSQFSVFAPSTQTFYIPSADAKSLVPSQDMSQIYGWSFQAVASPVIGSVVPSGDYYFTVKSKSGQLFLNASATQNQAAVLMPTFNLSASVFAWHAEAPATFSPKCNPTWNADETMNTFMLTFVQESPMELPFQVTDKGGIITTNAPNMTFIGLPYQRKNSTVIILFRPSAWPLFGDGGIVQPVAFSTGTLPASINSGTYQIKHQNAYLDATGQLSSQAVNWLYDAQNAQLSLSNNPTLCLLNPNGTDLCSSATQALKVGNCSGADPTQLKRFLLATDGTFRDPVTKLCYNDTILAAYNGGGGAASYGNTQTAWTVAGIGLGVIVAVIIIRHVLKK